MKKEKVLIAHGALGWFGGERRSDRYGAITVFNENSYEQKIVNDSIIYKDVIDTLVGKNGKIVAVVLETRKSTHIGDLFRGFYPKTPKVGQTIKVGEGEFFTEIGHEGRPTFGVKPADGRESDWLIPKNLYKLHEQSVDIFFIPS